MTNRLPPRVRVLALAALLLAASSVSAEAQRLAYLMQWGGPGIVTSRCINPITHVDSCLGRILIIDVDNGAIVGEMPAGHGAGTGLAVSRNGLRLAWAQGFNASVVMLDRRLQTGDGIEFSGPNPANATRFLPGNSDDVFYAVGEYGVHQFRPGSAKAMVLSSPATFASASGDGSSIAVATTAGVTMIDTVTNTVSATITLSGQSSFDLALSPDGATVFALRGAGTKASPGTITLYAVAAATGMVTNSLVVPSLGDLEVSPDGSSVWLSEGNTENPVSTPTPKIRSFTSDTLTLVNEFTIPLGGFSSMTIGGDGSRLLAIAGSKLFVVDTANGNVLHTLSIGVSNGSLVMLPPDAPCAFLVAPSTFQVAAAGGSVQVSVPAQAGCAWNALTSDAWLRPLVPSSGAGAGTLTITVAANAGIYARTGTVMIGGLTVSVTQAGPPAVPGTPGPPQSVSASVLPGGFARLAWLPPGSGPAHTQYIVEAGTVPGGQDVVVAPVGLLTTVTGGPLAAATYYTRVRAANAAGMGLPSEEVKFTINPAPDRPGIVTMIWTSPQSGRLSWAFNTARTMRISVGRTDVAADVGSVEVSNGTSQLTVSATDLPFGQYFLRLTGVNDQGTAGPTSDALPVWFGGACGGAPSTANTFLFVSGGPFVTADIGGISSPQPFTAHRFYVGTAPGASNVAVVDSPTSRASGFLPSGTYYIRAALVNACGVSAPTNERTLIIP